MQQVPLHTQPDVRAGGARYASVRGAFRKNAKRAQATASEAVAMEKSRGVREAPVVVAVIVAIAADAVE